MNSLKWKHQSLAVATLISVIFTSPASAFAQSTSVDTSSQSSTTTSTTIATQQSVEATSASLTTSLPITEDDLGVPKPTRWEFIKRRISRTFSFSPVKRLRLDNERSKLLLVQARVELEQGNTQKATELIGQYNKTMSQVVTEATTLAGQVSTQDNQQAQILISQITDQKVLEASALDSLSLKATGEFNRKVTDAKLKALRDLVKILDKENLTPAELHKKLDQISEKLEKKTTKAEEKFAKRLAFKEELDKANEDGAKDKHIGEILDEQEDETLDEIAKTQKENLGKIVREIEGSVQKHVLVLEELLARVPAEAKPAIQESIDRSQKKLAEALEKIKDDQGEIEEKIDEAIGEAKERQAEAGERAKEAQKRAIEAQKKALDRIKERADDNKRLKEEIKKRTEKLEEELKKRAEETKEETSQSPTPTGTGTSTGGTTTTPSSSGTGGAGTSGSGTSSGTSGLPGTSGSGTSNIGSNTGSSETASPEPKTYEVKYKDGRFDTSNVPSDAINTNDSIKFKNDDDVAIDIESNPHPVHTSYTPLNIGRLAKGEEKTVKFTQAGTIGFHNHLIPSTTASVTVK